MSLSSFSGPKLYVDLVLFDNSCLTCYRIFRSTGALTVCDFIVFRWFTEVTFLST